ncbi:MAG TPA: hypothetical protein VGB08_09205 [Allosphingosinicella sp.]|jgi:hypothetical protein
MKLFLLSAAAAVAALPACTANVYHPTKTAAEMQADVDSCTATANGRYWMDPVAALYRAYDCLEARGYQRSERDFAARVERALGERRRERAATTAEPCAIPCRR